MPLPRLFPLTLILLATTLRAQPQKCPDEATSITIPATINGTLEYHPGVYAWYGLRPSQPACGQKVIQLGFDDHAAFLAAHRFIGCEVTATGNLFVPNTGYWSTPLGITDARIQPDKSCKPGDSLPDYSAIPIPFTLRKYKIVATYDPKTFDFSAQAFDPSGKPLSPWEAYANDIGNGARDLQRMFCANGFSASDPKDASGQPSLQANVDPDDPSAVEVAIPDDTTPVHVSFTCTRSAAAGKE